MTSTFHLVAGPIGAGKTTLTRQLAETTGGVVFSIDEWMTSLFGPDMSAPIDPAWVFERVERCNRRILATAQLVASRGVDVVLDLGFTRLADRRAAAAAAQAGSHDVRLHWLDVPAAERWARVERRNREQGATYALTVTRPMFDFMEELCQEPDAAEMSALNGRRVPPSGS